MLDKRAEYEDPKTAFQDLKLQEGGVDGFRHGPMPTRTRPRVAPIWIHPHETATHDYFWGGWISCVIEQDQWVLSKPGQTPYAPGVARLPDPAASGDPSAAKDSGPKEAYQLIQQNRNTPPHAPKDFVDPSPSKK